MKNSTIRATLIFLPALALAFSPALLPAPSPPASPAPPLAFGTESAFYSPRFAPAAAVRESLLAVNRTWGIFPSVRAYVFAPAAGSPGLLILRGEKDDLLLARDVAAALDELGVPASLVPIPLEWRRAAAVKGDLIAISRASGVGWSEDDFTVFPAGGRGELFFRGEEEEAEKVRELAARLDQAEHAAPADVGLSFLRLFRKDLVSHFLTVSTLAASALLLVLFHFLLSRVPLLGRAYERWFTLVWTKLLDNVRGRDFAYEVLKDLVRTAVLSAEGAAREEKPAGPSLAPAGLKDRALASARELLRFRGFDPDDPRIGRLARSLLDAELSRFPWR